MNWLENIFNTLDEKIFNLDTVDFFIDYVSPVLEVTVITFSALLGLYKFYKTKNHETYQNLLNEVYAPLYQYFVKQEFLLDITKKDVPNKTVIADFSETTTEIDPITNETSIKKETFLDLQHDNFIKILDSVNSGLVPKELYTLLCLYKVLLHFENNPEQSKELPKDLTEFKNTVEKQLRDEVLLGYQKYHNKLGIKRNTKKICYKLDKTEFEFFNK